MSEFRGRVAEGDRADRLLALVVDRLAEAGLVKRRGRIRTDSTYVLAAVRRLNRGELVAETLRCALEDLAMQGEGAGRARCFGPGGPLWPAGAL
ncbi:hypothetical protein [Streptomyces sp. NPDC002265]|uniref:hypothetical protein n=1 Tax=Streptomyces sp. NPDC002265 TaxID=3154415 RepID=UPI00332F3343